MSQQQSPPSSNGRRIRQKRSRIACKRCHDRRVRCDAASIGTPCSGCISANLDDSCRLLASRRARGDNGRFSRGTPQPETAASLDHEALPSPQESQNQQRHPSEHVPEEGVGDENVWSKVVSSDYPLRSNGRRVVYVGEPWTLAYVMQWRGRSNPQNLSSGESPTGVHISVPVDSASPPRAQEALVVPGLSADTIRALIDSFFSRHQVLYPVLNEAEFRESWEAKSVSAALLYAVLYVGSLHAPDPVIYRAGFECRQSCLLSLYRRAKKAFFALDGDEAGDQRGYVQAAFLLHNMWQGPNAMMDPWTWLGLAIRMAQNIGMHRSTAQSAMSAPERRLWKRLWWCLYIRDRQIASALGKPLMINDRDCDVEPLSVDDFEEGDSETMRLFVVEQAKLSVLFGSAISTLFAVGPQDQPTQQSNRFSVMQQLVTWKSKLPATLKCPAEKGLESMPLQPLLLEVLFNCLLLLIHRSRQPMTTHPSQPQAGSDTTPFDAARAITRVAEVIMNHGSLTDCPLFFTSALFGAMTVHAIRGPEAEHQLCICMIAMRSLSTMYFAAGWIRNLFQKLSEKRSTSARPTRASSPQPGMIAESSLGEQRPEGPSMHGWAGLEQQEDWTAPAASANAFGFMGRTNIGGFLDYTWMSNADLGVDLADCWQDVLATEDVYMGNR